MASEYNVQFRAVHTITRWRKSKHYGLDNALRGDRGATELFAGRGEINYEKHGDPLYVIAWENGSAVGIAVKPDGNGRLLERSVSINFDDDVGVTVEILGRLFGDTSSNSRYWWVNHKQTYQAEVEGGYIWSPTENKNGARNQTYINLTLVRPGDIVISYAGAEIRAVGVATSSYKDQPKPEAFGQAGQNWSDAGWLVSVEWFVLVKPIPPKAHLADIVRRLPSKNSPLQTNGNGNQGCYLASISSGLGSFILEQAQVTDTAVIQRAQELEELLIGNDVEQEIQRNEELSSTEREQLIRSRVGQGIFRIRVAKQEKRCRLTGVDNLAFLVASHIKPWRHSDNDERLNGNNGLLLSPHVDKLFDRGWISFADDGRVLISEQAKTVAEAWGLIGAPNVGAFTSKQQAFLKYHREKIFRGGIEALRLA